MADFGDDAVVVDDIIYQVSFNYIDLLFYMIMFSTLVAVRSSSRSSSSPAADPSCCILDNMQLSTIPV